MKEQFRTEKAGKFIRAIDYKYWERAALRDL